MSPMARRRQKRVCGPLVQLVLHRFAGNGILKIIVVVCLVSVNMVFLPDFGYPMPFDRPLCRRLVSFRKRVDAEEHELDW